MNHRRDHFRIIAAEAERFGLRDTKFQMSCASDQLTLSLRLTTIHADGSERERSVLNLRNISSPKIQLPSTVL